MEQNYNSKIVNIKEFNDYINIIAPQFKRVDETIGESVDWLIKLINDISHEINLNSGTAGKERTIISKNKL
jgi:hypothetical protein